MKTLLRFLPLSMAPAMFFASCRSTEGAAVHWKNQPRPPVAAAAVRSDEYISAHYAEFRSGSSYPHTLSVWKDEQLLQSDGDKRVLISLGNQRGVFLVDGQIAMDFPVCTGMPKHPTPIGNFSITEKDADHWSNLYDCPMPYFMRLTNCGIGLHVGDVYRRPASHGCIRLTRDACIPLFHALGCGSKVDIVD